jgi:hypothetical protein
LPVSPVPAQRSRGDPLHDYRLPQFSTDARLRQPVTCTALGTPIADLLQRLSGQTGVSLRASQRTAQWRTVVRVDNLPLAELMASLAAAFDLSWRVLPGKEGQPPAYEIYQTPAQAQRERESFERRVQILERALLQALAEAQRRVEKGEICSQQILPRRQACPEPCRDRSRWCAGSINHGTPSCM